MRGKKTTESIGGKENKGRRKVWDIISIIFNVLVRYWCQSQQIKSTLKYKSVQCWCQVLFWCHMQWPLPFCFSIKCIHTSAVSSSINIHKLNKTYIIIACWTLFSNLEKSGNVHNVKACQTANHRRKPLAISH